MVAGALTASSPEGLAAYTREHGRKLFLYLPNLFECARAAALSGRPDVERIGRVLIAIGHFTAEGLAAGHFLVGYALRFRGSESPRHFEQARLAYLDLGSRTLEGLSALAAEGARNELLTGGAAVDGILGAFDGLALADPDCARQVVPGVARFLLILRVTRELAAGGAPPAELPAVTGDDISMLRAAMVGALKQPERVAPIARWIQSLRGLPADSTVELENMAVLLGDAHDWEPLVVLLRDMIAHGDRRPETLMRLAQSLLDTGRRDEAKVLLTAGVGDRSGPERLQLVQYLVMFCMATEDPDAADWAATLHSLGGELPASAMPAPSQLAELAEAATPRLLARYENGNLTVDPRLLELGRPELDAHMRAAVVLGLGSTEGAKFRDDIVVKEPALYRRVVELLPQHARPRSAADEHLASAETLSRRRRFREAIPEYKAAIEADPELEYAHLGLGNAYYMLGDFHLAVAHFTESIAIRPTPWAYRFLGDAILKGRHDQRRAKQCYEQALALDPAYAGALEALDRVTAELREGGASGR